MMGRGKSTISDELILNKVNGTYDSNKANAKAKNRRKAAKYQGKRIVANRKLNDFIDKALMQRQSPEAIAGRLKAGLEPGLPYVSRDTIETYIRSVNGRKIEYQLKVLRFKDKRKNSKRKRPSMPPRGDPKTNIDKRPSVIVNRERVGDMEVDFVVSGKAGKGSVLTATDRKLRNGFIRKIFPVTVGNVLRALLEIKKLFPEMLTITTDNDILFLYYKQLEKALGVKFYFCDPYSSWQKGGVENYNGEVRTYIPKGSDISQYNNVYIQMAEDKVNNRWMKVLGHKSPKEALEEYRNLAK
jgi:IS30 family transposase